MYIVQQQLKPLNKREIDNLHDMCVFCTQKHKMSLSGLVLLYTYLGLLVVDRYVFNTHKYCTQ